MAVKTITVTEEAYRSLKQMKRANESFSDVIKRLGSEKRSVSEFFGILQETESAAELQQRIQAIRKETSASFRRRHDRIRHLGDH